MTTRMHHPDHGWTHVYSEAERLRHEENGWKTECGPAPVEAPAAAIVPVSAPAAPDKSEEARASLRLLGVKVDGRWGPKRLAEELAKAAA